MIGQHPTGAIPGAVISAVGHEGLSVTVDGRPARLAIIDEHGEIIACGPEVAREAGAVARNSLQNLWKGKGWMRELSEPIPSMRGQRKGGLTAGT